MSTLEVATSGTVLVVDDDQGLTRLIESALAPVADRVATTHSAREAMDWLSEREADLILLDLRLPDMSGEALVERLLDGLSPTDARTNFIVITGFGDERVAVEMMKRGARDFLVKDETFLDLVPTVVHNTLDQLRRERVLDRTRETAHLLESAVHHMHDGVIITSSALGERLPQVAFVNPAVGRITGHGREQTLHAPLDVLFGERSAALREALPAVLQGDGFHHRRERLLRRDGTPYLGEVTVAPVYSVRGGGGDGGLRDEVSHLVFILRDVTEQDRLEQEARQNRRMEALGQLAGGVAHDFNNALTIILGHVELLRAGTPLGPEADDALGRIQAAGEHASSLTHQLLAFSRQRVSEPRTLNLGDHVERALSLVRRVIGEDIQVTLEREANDLFVSIDPSELEQVIINLVLNARDAMPRGGRVTLGVSSLAPEQPPAADDLGAGRRALLTVADEGHGMSAEVQEHIFEPFYTTKGPGLGTGLGLSTVYGIVHNAGGSIRVVSAPGEGAEFRILLPGDPAPESQSASAPTPARRLLGGQERILVVEDELSVAKLVERALTGLGYSVVRASSGEEAQALCDAGEAFDLVLTDLVMPGQSGVELVERILADRPGTKVLFMSGYVEGRLNQETLRRLDAEFIEKPFTPSELSGRIRSMLGRS